MVMRLSSESIKVHLILTADRCMRDYIMNNLHASLGRFLGVKSRKLSTRLAPLRYILFAFHKPNDHMMWKFLSLIMKQFDRFRRTRTKVSKKVFSFPEASRRAPRCLIQ